MYLDSLCASDMNIPITNRGIHHNGGLFRSVLKGVRFFLSIITNCPGFAKSGHPLGRSVGRFGSRYTVLRVVGHGVA